MFYILLIFHKNDQDKFIGNIIKVILNFIMRGTYHHIG